MDNPLFTCLFHRDFTHETPFTLVSLRQCLSGSGFDIVKINYEVSPKIRRGRLLGLIPFLKGTTLRIRKWFLGKLLGIPPDAFAPNLIAVGRKL